MFLRSGRNKKRIGKRIFPLQLKLTPVILHGSLASIINNEGITVKRGDTVLQRDSSTGTYIDDPRNSGTNELVYDIQFEGNEWLKPFSKTYTLNYSQGATYMITHNVPEVYYPENNTLSTTLVDSSNNGISGKSIKIYRNNTLIATKTTNSNGTISSVEELGKKRLAYEIKKLNEGYYVVVKFEAKPELITELERVYRITDEVMKFIVVKEEE